jgi:hypothetical protein
MKKTIILIASLLLFTSTCWAGEMPATMDKPSMSTSETIILTAMVEAINHETREVTLRGPDGDSVSFVASEEARNLGQVQAGDIVMAEYVQSMTIEVFANDGVEPGAGELAAAGRSEEGEMPGMVAIDTVVVTATVEEINIEANTFKLKGPAGETKEYQARNPENLKKAEVGDLVVITYTEAVAITVEKTTAE